MSPNGMIEASASGLGLVRGPAPTHAAFEGTAARAHDTTVASNSTHAPDTPLLWSVQTAVRPVVSGDRTPTHTHTTEQCNTKAVDVQWPTPRPDPLRSVAPRGGPRRPPDNEGPWLGRQRTGRLDHRPLARGLGWGGCTSAGAGAGARRRPVIVYRRVGGGGGQGGGLRHPPTQEQGTHPDPPPPLMNTGGGGGGRPAYAQPLSPSQQMPASMVTNSNCPQPLRQPPPTACLTASGAASKVLPFKASLPAPPPTAALPTGSSFFTKKAESVFVVVSHSLCCSLWQSSRSALSAFEAGAPPPQRYWPGCMAKQNQRMRSAGARDASTKGGPHYH